MADVHLVLVLEVRVERGAAHLRSFGNVLHVTGRDTAALDASMAEAASSHPEYRFEPAAPGLEDVFISLMDTVRDDR